MKSRAFKGIVWSAAEQWGTQLISFFVLVVLARLVNPEAFGLIAMATVSIAFANIFIEQGFGVALIQRKELDQKHINSAFFLSASTGSLIAVLVWVTAPLVAEFYTQPELVNVVRWLSVVLILGGLSGAQSAMMQKSMRFKELAGISLIASTLGGVIGVWLAFSGFGVMSLVAQQVSSSAVKLLLITAFSGVIVRFFPSLAHLKDLWAFSAFILANNMLMFVIQQFDKLVIGYFLGPVELGIYTLAFRLYNTIRMLLMGMLRRVALPMFSSIQHHREKMRISLDTATRLTATIAIPFFAGLCVLAPEVVELLLGDKWLEGVPILRVLAIVGLVEAATTYHGSVVLATGNPKWMLGFNFIRAIAYASLSLAVVHLGAYYVSLAYLFVSIVVAPLPIYFSVRLVKLRVAPHFRQLVPALFCSAVMSIVLLYLSTLSSTLPIVYSLIVMVATGMSLYLFLLMLLRAEVLHEIRCLIFASGKTQ